MRPAEELDPEDKTDPQIRVPGRSFPFPLGLLVVLVLYGLAVLGYVWSTYWRSPEYQAAQHWDAARMLLGKDGGRTAPDKALLEAYAHLLEAGRLKPEVRTFHEEAQSLNWRFEERGSEAPLELRRIAQINAAAWQAIEKLKQPVLVIGLRDKGWAPDQLLEGPARVAKWSPVGALFIVAIWGYLRLTSRRVRDEEKEEGLREWEREIDALGEFRRRR